MLFFGVLGYILKKNGYPTLPIIISVILGPIFEVNLRISLLLNNGNPAVFLKHPIALGFILLGILFVIITTVLPKIRAPKSS
jgi:putative tricarboxylic transport membrane protein